jgi:hypothetical protein
MSVTSVLDYFKTGYETIGFVEWTDPFNIENIPSTVLEKAFHVELGTGVPKTHTQTLLEVLLPVTVKSFRKGYRNAASALRACSADVDTVMNELMKAENRFTQSTIKNVLLSRFSFDRLGTTNDNIAILSMEFEVLVLFNP